MKLLTAKGFHFYEEDEKWLVRGVTYGPFQPNESGAPYPEPAQIQQDFKAMAKAGVNCIRLYAQPHDLLMNLAAEHGLRLLVDVPWPKHIDVYDNPDLERLCIRMVEEEMSRLKGCSNLMGVVLGNEIPPDLVRWHGPRRVERFLRKLYGIAKAQSPGTLIGFCNYPSTEYLHLHFFDFLGFNVYLHDTDVLHDYLTRLRHMYPEKPILLSEAGVDTCSHSEEEQSAIILSTLCAAYQTGMAGAFVFSWTDEWHTGGYDINDWAFGIVDAERRRKAAYYSVARAFRTAPQSQPLFYEPKVSIVVATYNGGRTLRQCLESLIRLKYAKYEIVVVDDGSTDNTADILKDFPDVLVIHQPNRGLSMARNAGILAAQGEVVAFTDSDCFVDPDWLYHLVTAMRQTKSQGMGGPNLTPPSDRWDHKCVAMAPGHATHVLLNATEAEHVPGCNMAFHRDALLAVGMFDPIFRKAGDDVDIIWRLQEAGYRAGFTTGAFVWHHRRPTVNAYWRQQMGYGEAETLLLHKHPHRFNDRGHSLWRGMIYPAPEMRPLWGRPMVHYGVFGSAGYQCIYERPAGMFYYLATSLEWWVMCAALLLLGAVAQTALWMGVAGVAVSLIVSGVKAWQVWRERPRNLPWRAILLTWALWITQPLLRAGMRYWSRIRGQVASTRVDESTAANSENRSTIPSKRCHILQYWSDDGVDRLDVLRILGLRMGEDGWLATPNMPWAPWDFKVAISWWFHVLITSAAEDHGDSKRLLRLRLDLRPSSLFRLLLIGGAVICMVVALQDTIIARVLLIALLAIVWFFYHQARRRQSQLVALCDDLMLGLNYITFEQSAHSAGNKREPLPLTPAEKEHPHH